jgi:hypothetical protein
MGLPPLVWDIDYMQLQIPHHSLAPRIESMHLGMDWICKQGLKRFHTLCHLSWRPWSSYRPLIGRWPYNNINCRNHYWYLANGKLFNLWAWIKRAVSILLTPIITMHTCVRFGDKWFMCRLCNSAHDLVRVIFIFWQWIYNHGPLRGGYFFISLSSNFH